MTLRFIEFLSYLVTKGGCKTFRKLHFEELTQQTQWWKNIICKHTILTETFGKIQLMSLLFVILNAKQKLIQDQLQSLERFIVINILQLRVALLKARDNTVSGSRSRSPDRKWL